VALMRIDIARSHCNGIYILGWSLHIELLFKCENTNLRDLQRYEKAGWAILSI